MIKRTRCYAILALAVLCLAGCGQSNRVVSTTAPLSAPLPTQTAVPVSPPYTGRPFSLLFLRGGSLWLAETGGGPARRLSAEPPGWTVSEYTASPDGLSVAYIALRSQGEDGVVRLLRLADGAARDLAGRGDAYLESGLRWLDADHLAYARGGQAEGELAANFDANSLYNHRVLDLAGGEDRGIPESADLSQSPDGSFWASCVTSYVYEGNCRYMLRERSTGAQWPVAVDKIGGGLVGWSADSASLLFLAQLRLPAVYPQLLLVNVETRAERLLSPADKIVLAAAWAPHRAEIAFIECPSSAAGGSDGCLLRFVSAEGEETTRPIRLAAHISASQLAWTPDGERLVLAGGRRAAWSLGRDGSDLRLLVDDAEMVRVLGRP